jgi:hypothetical protein
MGTNLSQVFISNTDVLESGTSFTGIASTPEIGIWNLAGNAGAGAYVNTALYQATADLTDLDTGETLVAIANPLWFYRNLQFVQGTAGNPIATPMINTRNIRRIKYDPFVVSAGHQTVIDVGTALNSRNATFKFVLRTTPVDQLSFYDADGTGLPDLSGNEFQFPLGAFNTTNHKVINVESLFAARPTNDEAGLYDHLVTLIAANPILNALFNVTDGATTCTIAARHPGVIFDLIINNDTDGTTLASSVQTVTGFVPGTGNAWQVLGEEIRCRSRYGNFNRMYLPQNMMTYTQTAYRYDKVTIEYEHNWPTSTGIAPAGTLNQVVLYFTDTDGTAPVIGDSGTATYDNAFGITLATAAEFIW